MQTKTTQTNIDENDLLLNQLSFHGYELIDNKEHVKQLKSGKMLAKKSEIKKEKLVR